MKWDYDGSNSQCLWDIKAPAGQFVSIEPKRMIMPEPTDEYKLPISVQCHGYQYVTLLENLAARHVKTIKVRIDKVTNDAHFAFSPVKARVPKSEG